ncbi:unnamed protein product [Ceratitis capitata]|uniref:(Mediterranean fruit fly) hypothetical protein n=1 Tax=Ceratitis capitata TaxID=7213 RepID=A0A811URB3_CERCA|nr:unnamed protein product [Ceratitis capitata]
MHEHKKMQAMPGQATRRYTFRPTIQSTPAHGVCRWPKSCICKLPATRTRKHGINTSLTTQAAVIRNIIQTGTLPSTFGPLVAQALYLGGTQARAEPIAFISFFLTAY